MPFRLRRIATAIALTALPFAIAACGGGSAHRDDGAVVSIDTPSGKAGSPVIVPKNLSVGTTTLPDASSTTAGATFALAPPTGHLNLVFFGYTNCPDVCPGTMRTASQALGLLKGRAGSVSIAMVSVDPRRDTATRMRTWVSALVAGGHGHGLRTDDKTALAAIEKRLAIVARPFEQNDFEYIEHTGGLFAVAPGGAVVAEWPYGVDPPTLAGDITKLLNGQSVTST